MRRGVATKVAFVFFATVVITTAVSAQSQDFGDQACIPDSLTEKVMQCPEVTLIPDEIPKETIKIPKHPGISARREAEEARNKCRDSCRVRPEENSVSFQGSISDVGCEVKCEHEAGKSTKPLRPRQFTSNERAELEKLSAAACSPEVGDRLPEFQYRRAFLYYFANHFAEAAVLFRDIALNHSSNENAASSANYYIECLDALGNKIGDASNAACYVDLADIVDVFINQGKEPGSNLMRDADLAKTVRSLKVDLLRRRAESRSERGRYVEAAEIYLLIDRDFPDVYDEGGRCEVLFNAAINLEAARLFIKAIEIREKLLKLYPNCEHSKKNHYFIGQAYQAIGMFSEAAAHYEKFAESFPQIEESRVALSNAITFRIADEEEDLVFKDTRLFEKLFGAKFPKEAATVFFCVGYYYLLAAREKGGDKNWSRVRGHYLEYLDRYGDEGLLDEQVQAWVFIGDSYYNQKKPDLSQAKNAYRKATAIFDAGAMDRTPENRRKAQMLNAAAKAGYYLALEEYRAFGEIDLPKFTPKRKIPKKVSEWWRSKTAVYPKPPSEIVQESLCSIERSAVVGLEQRLTVEERERIKNDLVKRKICVPSWGLHGIDCDTEAPQFRALEHPPERQSAGFSCSFNLDDSANMPSGTDRDIQFAYWLEESVIPRVEEKRKALDVASSKLVDKVVNMHVSEWEIAAYATFGDMRAEFAQFLAFIPTPPSVRKIRKSRVEFERQKTASARMLLADAIGFYDFCLDASKKTHFFIETSKHCAMRLSELDSEKYPIDNEIKIEPNRELDLWAIPEPILNEPASLKSDYKESSASGWTPVFIDSLDPMSGFSKGPEAEPFSLF